MTAAKLILKDTTNWWLSYLLAQPVDFDVVVLLYFLSEYTGCIRLYEWQRNLRSALLLRRGIFFRRPLMNS